MRKMRIPNANHANPAGPGRGELSHYDRGFTLMEVIISFGIFSTFVVVAIGIVIGVSNAQIKAANIQTIQDNIRFGLELMTKEMRTGSGFRLSNFCTSAAGEEVSFVTVLGSARVYYREDTGLMRVTGSTNCDTAQPVSSEDVRVEKLRFLLSGQTPGPSDGQPRITIAARMRSVDPKFQLESSMNLQTTVVQRLRDL